MPKYKYPNLCTIYNCCINGEQYNTRFSRSACYGTSLSLMHSRGSNTASYTIMLITDSKYVDNGYNNYCWMTKHQVECYLRRIASIKPFSYKVFDANLNGSTCYKIELNISGTKKEITFVLQSIKRLYECPYNFYLQQAYMLQELPAFKFDSILNLFDVIFSTYDSSKNHDHCFSGNTKFEKYSTLRERLPHVIYASDLFPTYVSSTKRTTKISGMDYYGNCPANTEDWTEDYFRSKLPEYVENYNRLKR